MPVHRVMACECNTGKKKSQCIPARDRATQGRRLPVVAVFRGYGFCVDNHEATLLNAITQTPRPSDFTYGAGASMEEAGRQRRGQWLDFRRHQPGHPGDWNIMFRWVSAAKKPAPNR
jgi:hypothetical protein